AMTASRSADGRAALAMPVTQGGQVQIQADGEERVVEPRGGADLDMVLRLAELEVEPADRVAMSLDEAGTPVLTVNRVETRQSTRTEDIEYETEERET